MKFSLTEMRVRLRTNEDIALVLNLKTATCFNGRTAEKGRAPNE